MKKSTKKAAKRPTTKPKKKAAKTKARRKQNAAFMAPMQPDAALAAVVGEKPLPRPKIVSKLWEYIKKNKLQSVVNGREIICDHKLEMLFGVPRVGIFELHKLLSEHLTKAQ